MGCGSVADFGHLPAIGRCSEFELVGLFDPVPGRAATYAAKFGGTTRVQCFSTLVPQESLSRWARQPGKDRFLPTHSKMLGINQFI